jgi:hypothetical protein
MSDTELPPNGLFIIDRLITKSGLTVDGYLKLIPRIYDYGLSKIGCFSNSFCDLNYDEKSNEMFFWTLGLMSLEWVLGILNLKLSEGLCEKHVEPCEESIEFHKEMFERCKKSIQEVLDSFEQ